MVYAGEPEVSEQRGDTLTRAAQRRPIGKRLVTTQNAAVIDGRAHRNDTEQRHPARIWACSQ
jgi:hypothetical protein